MAALLGTPAFAVREYYGISRSVRALGMGGAFYGYCDDEAALFYNPAGLSLYPGGGQFLFNFQSNVAHDALKNAGIIQDAVKLDGLENIVASIEQLQGKPIYVDASFMPYFLARGFGLAILAPDVKADFALLGAGVDSVLDVTAIGDAGLLMGFGGRLAKRLHFGVTTKFLYRAGGHRQFSTVEVLGTTDLALEDLGGAGGGVDADMGFTYEFPGKGIRSGGVSLVFQNLVASNFPIARHLGAPPALTRTVSAGGYVQWTGKKVINYLRLVGDFAEVGLGGESNPDEGGRGGSVWKHVNLGAEMPLWGWLYLRAGIHQGAWTGGLGISAYAMKLDLASYAEELSSAPGRLMSRRWGIRFALGFGAPSASAKPSRSRR